MKICHYCLGLPPYRTGGVPTFVNTLIKLQSKTNDVSILYPGHYSLFKHKPYVRKSNSIYKNIKAFEIVNPKPVPLCNGILNVDMFTKEYPSKVFYDFLIKYHFDLIHIHTLFALDKSFFQACKELNIKTIFTSHDLFGLCPLVYPINFDICHCQPSKLCSACCKQALSSFKIHVLQSNSYLKFKNSFLIRHVRKNAVRNLKKYQVYLHNNTDNIDTTLFTAKSKTYDKLQHYYLDLLKNIDFIHFNSYLTRNVFLNFFRPNKYIVNFISTSSIKDNRFSHNKIVDDTFINFVILGDNQGAYDVFNYFDKLWALGYSNFHLTIYTRNFVESKPYLTTKGSYIFSDLPLILDNADALIYNESSFATFSFIVLEALSFGVPCIVCGKVGAKDIVALNDCGFVIDTPSELGELLLYILKYPLSLADKQKNLLNANINFEQDDFIDIYRNLISEN